MATITHDSDGGRVAGDEEAPRVGRKLSRRADREPQNGNRNAANAAPLRDSALNNLIT